MTQEEINNLKVGDCFIYNSTIYKIVKKGNDLIRVSYISIYSYAIIKDEINLFCNAGVITNSYLCNKNVYDKALKVLSMAETSLKSIIASSSAMRKKED